MKAHHNAEKLFVWLLQHQPATIKQITASGLLNSREASDSVRYAIRCGVIEAHRRAGAAAEERVPYQLTGRPLPAPKTAAPAPSFDALLSAWGIAQVPPTLPSRMARRVEFGDSNHNSDTYAAQIRRHGRRTTPSSSSASRQWRSYGTADQS